MGVNPMQNVTATDMPSSSNMGVNPMQNVTATDMLSSSNMGVNPMQNVTATEMMLQSSSDFDATSDLILPVPTKIVLRVADYRPVRGKRQAQYLLVFKDQPLSESMWVDTTECGVFAGFDAALKEHQCRRVLRSAA